jgi:D-alanyl-D-alanine carboxypeptidase/D-alanyl-D-alanine-endopeptidase (penicillin-binding protein 4)
MKNNFINRFLVLTILLITLFMLFVNISQAQGTLKDHIESIIKNDSLSKTTLIAISIRDAQTGTLIYERYGNYLLHTASTLKALTTPVGLKYLGAQNSLKTQLFRSSNASDIYIKITGDPLLTSEELFKLVQKAGSKGLKEISGDINIDISNIDSIPWGTGWMWDDENSPLMPKYGAYMLDQNVVKVSLSPDVRGGKPHISLKPLYPVKIVNEAITGSINKYKLERRPWQDPEAIYLSGIVGSPRTIELPVGIPSNYFKARLRNALKSADIHFNGKIKEATVPANAQLLSEISHPIVEVISFINQTSNNPGAEMLLKLAGKAFTGKLASTENGLLALQQYYKNIGAFPHDQNIVDGSGASHNDLLQPNWMTMALSKIYNTPARDIYLKTLAQPGERGTLKYRHTDLKNRLWAKTGTLSGISGLTGYIQGDTGKVYSFAILIQNYKGTSFPAKALESKIINKLKNY